MHIKKCFTAIFISSAFLSAGLVNSHAAEAPVQQQKVAKPNVVILATGGTIAGSAASNTQMTGYKAGALGIDVLLQAVPEIHKVANVKGEQISNIGSESMNNKIWLKLAKRINELLAKPDVDGIVITHGTDTLEETAYFLNLVTKSDKPVVIIGAMRPATAISADGPVNILNAVNLAASKDAKGRGVLIAMNDNINGARDVQKTNTLRVDTFQSPELGYLGYFENGRPVFYKATTRKHTIDTEFDVSNLNDLPRVDIIYSHVNDDGRMAEAAVANGAKVSFMPELGTALFMKQLNQLFMTLPRKVSLSCALPEFQTARRLNLQLLGIRQDLFTPARSIRKKQESCCSWV